MHSCKLTLSLLILITALVACHICYAKAQGSNAAHTLTNADNVYAKNGLTEPADVWLPKDWRRIPRLQILTTFVQRDTTIADAVRALRLSTGAKLQAEGNEVLPSHVTLRYHNVPLADVLRGIAATRDLIWEKTPGGELLLHQRRRAHAMDVFHPHSEAEAEMWRLGQELVRQASSLPPDLQKDLLRSPSTNHTTAPDGAAFTDLPPAMQQTVRAMYVARAQMMQEADSQVHISPNELPSTRIRMDVNEQEGLTHHGFLICGDKKGEGMWTTKFKDTQEGNTVIPLEAVGPMPMRTYPGDAATQQEAQADAACLKTHVSLTTGSYTLEEVLLELAKQAHFHFAMPLDNIVVTRKFRCKDEPLGDVLPRLCRAFAFTTPRSGLRWEWSWNWRKGDFFVFHTRPDTTKPDGTDKPDVPRPAGPSPTQSK